MHGRTSVASIMTHGSQASDTEVIPELRAYPPSLDTKEVAEVLGIVNPAEVSGRLAGNQWPGFRIGIQWRMRRSVVQRIMLGLDPWEGQENRVNQPRSAESSAPDEAV
jgi:hypothetical protein